MVDEYGREIEKIEHVFDNSDNLVCKIVTFKFSTKYRTETAYESKN